MKKIKLMMPALAIASTAAAVTPFVTSCKNNGIQGATLSHNLVVKKREVEYKYKYKPAKTQKFDKYDDLAREMSNTIQKDSLPFLDDMLCYIAAKAQPGLSVGEVKSATITITNYSESFWYAGVISELFSGVKSSILVSFDVKMDIIEDLESDGDLQQSYNLKFNNIPFILALNSSDGTVAGYQFNPITMEYGLGPKWSITASMSFKTKDDIEPAVLEQTAANNTELKTAYAVQMIMSIFGLGSLNLTIPSNYFSKWLVKPIE